MKLGIMQPYLFPYIGYFQLINAVDNFVVYDDVQYIKNGWINRNAVLQSGGNASSTQFTFSVRHDSFEKKINDRQYSDAFPIEAKRFLKTLYYTYHNAPYYADAVELIQEILAYNDRCVSQYNTYSLQKISAYLGIKTKFLQSSTLKIPSELKSQDRVLWVCKHLGATTYVNSIGGQSLYCKEAFASRGLALYFLKPGDISYQQFSSVFVPNLSIIDVMMFNSPQKIGDFLNTYTLI
ncbi:MAG TPA: WbqC family protein [Fervidobacterium sp.]|nr:WbqC family protein [Fervidobacterium sp.]HUM44614.1 WbqC family protein [Fervidobacterium sp.]